MLAVIIIFLLVLVAVILGALEVVYLSPDRRVGTPQDVQEIQKLNDSLSFNSADDLVRDLR